MLDGVIFAWLMPTGKPDRLLRVLCIFAQKRALEFNLEHPQIRSMPHRSNSMRNSQSPLTSASVAPC